MSELELPRRPRYEQEVQHSGLSERGTKLSASGTTLDKFKKILGEAYDSVTNPHGIINIGTAENVVACDELWRRLYADYVSVYNATRCS